MQNIYKPLLLVAFLLVWFMPLSAQTPINLGKSADVGAKFKAKAANAKKINKTPNSSKISQFIPGQDSLILNLKVSKKEGKADVFIGEVDNKKNSTFFLKVSVEELSGFIILKEQKKSYKYSSKANGQAFLQEVDIDKVVCIEYQEGPVKSSATTSEATAAGATVPELQSLPGAAAVVLLDFNGQYVSGTYWNSGNPIDAAPANLTSAEMLEVWKMISEDYEPFSVNITTSEAAYLNAPANRRMRVVFTPTDFFYPGSGGVAYVNSFTWGNETPCWVFNTGAKFAGEAGSHEIGHTLGLSHDGRTSPSEAYYYGQGSWAPIMGAGYYSSLVQWSKGEYLNANNLEDDLSIITTQNGFSYKPDDHANTSAGATVLRTDNTGKVTASANTGIISSGSDVDVFSFQTGGGSVALTASPNSAYANLDISLTLKNSSNKTLVVSEPAELSASIKQSLAAGTYYVYIQGAKGASGADSNYGSTGRYSISGTIPATLTGGSVLIASGGTQYTDGQSRSWSADANFSGGVTSSKSFDVAGTTDDGLYLKYRYAASKAPFSYSIPVGEAGTYRVKLHFLEPYFGAPGGRTSGLAGARVFHVDLEGKRVLTNYDIYTQDGAGKAVVKTFENVTVSDGVVNINFTSVADNAIISGIEIEKVVVPSYTLAVNTTGSGSVTKSPNQTTYVSGTSVTLTAKAATGYQFSGWSGDATGTVNPLSVTMNSNKAITANFKQLSESSTGPVLVASGGTQYTDGQSRSWGADANFSGGVTSSKSFDVAGTTDDGLYLKYRYAASKAPFSYSIPVGEAGTYRVKLHFLEPYFGAPGGRTSGLAGARVFHVDLEGKRVLTNYDIYTQDGAGKAVVKTFENVTVSDGVVNINFTSVADNAIISGIEIEKVAASDPVAAALRMEAAENLTSGEKNLELYPNPFSDRVKVSFTSALAQPMELKIYDSKGREVANLFQGNAAADQAYEFEWTPEAGQASGMYFLRMLSPSGTSYKKIIFNR
ncbi:malectin domain-containing carbohydrate-binding protein [Pontibacter pamirensis]|uniref:malectin domain-containing carbohydrate-binding protein n=1 Tax=Pontibacter pamirensis TaxID=2562824 RepID=UPI001389D326|nr:malectin domain-containing carbohydrate-binding protein [Pontibacter pamirensis]